MLFAFCAWAEAVGGEASTIEDLGEGPDNVERYRKTVQPLATVQGACGEAVFFFPRCSFGNFPCLLMSCLLAGVWLGRAWSVQKLMPTNPKQNVMPALVPLPPVCRL